jgi:hypothetical protein
MASEVAGGSQRRPIAEQTWFKGLLCIVALAGTVLLAGYQRRTGPSWPIEIDTTLAGAEVAGELPRSHGGPGGAAIDLYAPDPAIEGRVVWRRYPTSDPWHVMPLSRVGSRLIAELPHQPPAGKLEYSLRLRRGETTESFPRHETAVIRFRGDVPAYILIPHILLMFLALTVVLRTGLALAVGDPAPERFVPWTLLMMVPGGLILGPLVQKYAFGAYWTGWPVGDDWTDTKTLAAVAAWIAAGLIARRASDTAGGARLKRAVLSVATAVTLAVYLIPHSAHGSELDWSKVDDARAPQAGKSNASSPPRTTSFTWPPRSRLPNRISSVSGRLTCSSITRPSGRAPKLGSCPSSASLRRAASVSSSST